MNIMLHFDLYRNVMSTLIVRDLAKEINRRWAEIGSLAEDSLFRAIELGKELTKARSEIGHGFGPWLEKNCTMSRQYAYRLIKLNERRDEIGSCGTIFDAIKTISGNTQEQWVMDGHEEGEPPLSEANPQPDHIEVLSNEIHPMFMLDPVQKKKWSAISGAKVYRTVINGKRARVSGTEDLLQRGSEQGITRLPEQILSLDQGNQQRREGIRKEDAWAARQWTDAAMARLAPNKSERGLQLVQFLSHGMPAVQRSWLEEHLGMDLNDPEENIVDTIWALLLIRSDDDIWGNFKSLAGLDKDQVQKDAREEHKSRRGIK